MGWVISITPHPLYPRKWDLLCTVQEKGCVPGSVRTGAESLKPTGIWSPDYSARSKSLSRPRLIQCKLLNCYWRRSIQLPLDFKWLMTQEVIENLCEYARKCAILRNYYTIISLSRLQQRSTVGENCLVNAISR